jgi:predicted amidohydrolase YtcJ
VTPAPSPARSSFVDHHVHLLRVAAGAKRAYTVGQPKSIADFHRRVAAEGSSPMDQPPSEPAADDVPAALLGGLGKAADLGLVGVTEAGLDDWALWDALVSLPSASLPCDVRVLVASGAADLQRMERARAEENDEHRAVVGVKFYADGWLGPRTCACSEPFADVPAGPDDRGILFQDAATLARRMAPYAAAGWGLATHAIGDRAIEACLDAYSSVYGSVEAVRAAVPRIEHAQVLRPELVERMADLGVVACIQPCFATSDAESIALALAGRFPMSYRWDLLLEAGVRVIAGSDFPIETLDPTIGLERLVQGEFGLPEDVALRLLTTPLDALWPR